MRGVRRRAGVGRVRGRCKQLGTRARERSGRASVRSRRQQDGHAARGALGARARGANRRAGHGRLGGTGVRPVRTGWASWVLVHPAWFSTWFFDSVFFLSH